jgi:hypothetical protein
LKASFEKYILKIVGNGENSKMKGVEYKKIAKVLRIPAR